MVKKDFKRHLIILLVYAILAIIFTYPLVVNINDHIPGSEDALGGAVFESIDAWLHLWTLEWVRKTVLSLENPYYTHDLFHPNGVSLAFHGLTLGCFPVFSVLRLFFGVIASYNLLYILSLILASYCMYLLVHYLTKNRAASFIMGFAYGFCPYRLAHVFVNHIEHTGSALIPLFVLVLIKVCRGDKGRFNVVLGSVLLLLISLIRWHYGLYLVLFAVFYFVFFSGKIKRKNKINVLAMGLVFVIVVAPFVYPMIKIQDKIEDVRDRNVADSADLTEFFTPSYLHPFFSGYVGRIYRSFTAYNGDQVNFLGYTLLALLAYSLVKKRKAAAFWLACFFLFFILSLGPYPHFLGKAYNLPLPYLLIRKVPFFSVIRAPRYFGLMAMFSLCVIGGYSLKSISLKLRQNTKKIFLIAVFFLICFEFLAVLPTREVVVPAVYKELAKDKSDYGIVELQLGSAIFMFYQLTHNKRIADAYVSRIPIGTYDFIKNNSLILALDLMYPDSFARWKFGIEDNFSKKELEGGHNKLVENGIRYIFIHNKEKLDASKVKEKLGNFGGNLYVCDGMLIYSVIYEEVVSKSKMCSVYPAAG